jgi:hypothetical protein
VIIAWQLALVDISLLRGNNLASSALVRAINALKAAMIRKLKNGKYRIYSKKKDPNTGKRRNLGTFNTREEAKKHEQEIHAFKHMG